MSMSVAVAAQDTAFDSASSTAAIQDAAMGDVEKKSSGCSKAVLLSALLEELQTYCWYGGNKKDCLTTIPLLQAAILDVLNDTARAKDVKTLTILLDVFATALKANRFFYREAYRLFLISGLDSQRNGLFALGENFFLGDDVRDLLASFRASVAVPKHALWWQQYTAWRKSKFTVRPVGFDNVDRFNDSWLDELCPSSSSASAATAASVASSSSSVSSS
jgi:hypothetical protein